VEEEPARLIRLDLETLEKNELTQPPAGTGVIGDLHPSVSPDGSLIVFDSNDSGNLDVYLVEVDSGQVRQLTLMLQTTAPPASPAMEIGSTSVQIGVALSRFTRCQSRAEMSLR
jgi:hypothetical protein